MPQAEEQNSDARVLGDLESHTILRGVLITEVQPQLLLWMC